MMAGDFLGVMSGWRLPAAGETRNPFAKASADQPARPTPDTSSLWNIKKPEAISISFHFGTGRLFTSSIDPKKNFTDQFIESHIPKGAQLPTAPKLNVDVDEAPNDPGTERTGEEDDDILFNQKAQLCAVLPPEGDAPGSYVEKAVGPLHFNRCRGCYRLVMRHSDGRRPTLNLRVFEQMQPTMVGREGKRINFLGKLEGGVKAQILSIKLRADAAPLLHLWQTAIEEVKSGKDIVPESAKGAA
jgi:hypothetical protein